MDKFMKLYIKLFVVVLSLSAVFISVSCRHSSQDAVGETGRTQRTEFLLRHLTSQTGTAGYLLGHADDTLYGVGWSGDSAHSDVRNAVGDLPALIALDISGIDRPVGRTSEKVRQQWLCRLRTAAIQHFDRGGAILLTWCPQSHDGAEMGAALDSVVSFLASLRTGYGVRVPVMLRPCPDGQGWWSGLSASRYRQLWQQMAARLKSKELPNVLMVYSRRGRWMEARCPEAEADLIEARVGKGEDGKLQAVAVAARKHRKPLGVALEPSATMPDKVWTTEVAPLLAPYPVAYLLTAANRDGSHFGVPFLGHPALSDFVKFCNQSRTLLLHDVNALYLPHRDDSNPAK